MRPYLSVAEQLARKREWVAEWRRQSYTAEEIVNAYARAFYRAISSELAAGQVEFERARVEGIHPRHAALLYEVSFSDIEEFVYSWLKSTPQAALNVARRIVALPSLTYAPERDTTYGESHMAHVKKIEVIIKSWPSTQSVAGPYAIGQLATIIEMIYTLLETFNHSHQLSRREQETMPANLALLSVELKEELACLKLPRLAQEISYGDVRGGASTQHTAEMRYPKSLWADDLSAN